MGDMDSVNNHTTWPLRAREMLGCKPKVSLEDDGRRPINWLKEIVEAGTHGRK